MHQKRNIEPFSYNNPCGKRFSIFPFFFYKKEIIKMQIFALANQKVLSPPAEEKLGEESSEKKNRGLND